MIKVFRNDDKSYIEWQERKLDGYVLKTKFNRGTAETLSFHKSCCPHIYKYTYMYEEKNGALVKAIKFTSEENIKVCSTNADKLVHRADNNRLSAKDFKICKTCDPHDIRKVVHGLLTGWKEVC